jgi:hypothetical protein
MTEPQFHAFLTVAAWVCAVACILNLLNLKRRGNTALLLSAAYLTMAGILWMVKLGASTALLVLGGIVLLALLLFDFGLRSRHEQERPR